MALSIDEGAGVEGVNGFSKELGSGCRGKLAANGLYSPSAGAGARLADCGSADGSTVELGSCGAVRLCSKDGGAVAGSPGGISEAGKKGFPADNVAGPDWFTPKSCVKGFSIAGGGLAVSAESCSCAARSPNIGVEKSDATSDTGGSGAASEGSMLAGASEANGSKAGVDA